MSKESEALKQQVSLRNVVAGVVKLEKRGGEYWGLCPFHSEKTPSFAVKVKNGEEVFFCQGCGKGGDVITFIELHDNVTKKAAFDKVKALAGNTEWREEAHKVQAAFQSVVETPKKTYSLASYQPKEEALQDNAEAIKYLEDVRGISRETARALHLGYSQSAPPGAKLKSEDEHARDAGWICFPRIVGDKVVACKMRSIVAKAFTQLADMDPKALFNTETINPMDPVFVTEGEYDTAIFEQADFRAVSLPNATTKLTPEWKVMLKKAPYVVLAGDVDIAGGQKMRELLHELGENTLLIQWPTPKDANDFFRNQCNRDITMFRQKVEELIAVARSTPVEGYTSLIQRLRNTVGTDGENDPYRLHFSIPDLDRMAYIPVADGGYCVFYSTYSGSGKSVLVTQVVIDEAKRGETVVVYSPELSGGSYLALIAAQTLPERKINRSLVVTREDYLAAADVLDQPTANGSTFQYYVGHEMPEGNKLGFIESVLKIIRPTRFVIDTFPCIVERIKGESTVEAEGRTAESISALGKKYGCIFLVVGQSNKEAEDIKEKRRDSHGVLRGSRVIYDKAHAVFLLHRKKKEDGTGQADLLEEKTLIAMEKNRTSGPGAQAVYLMYVREKSRFYLQDAHSDATMVESAPTESEYENY